MTQKVRGENIDHGYRPMRRALSQFAAALLAAIIVILCTFGNGSASAQGRVSVMGSTGASKANVNGADTLTITGSGFQSVPGGFGGVYVFFGWVNDPSGGSWRPSNGGTSGQDFQYIADSETRDNQGYQRFVAFPGSDTASAANGGVLSADGGFSVSLNIPGPEIVVTDRAGAGRVIDCRTQTCGVITLGAHGVANSNNETFTPIEFATAASAPSGSGQSSDAMSGGQSAANGDGDGDLAEAELTAGVGIDQETAVVGRVLSFAGRGFLPGEQLVATLDAGVAAVGPLTAGPSGEVAGVLQLPGDLRPGTHTLKLAGIASGQAPELEFEVARDPTARSSLPIEDDEGGGNLGLYFAIGAGTVFLAVLIWTMVVGFRARAARQREVQGEPADQEIEEDS